MIDIDEVLKELDLKTVQVSDAIEFVNSTILHFEDKNYNVLFKKVFEFMLETEMSDEKRAAALMQSLKSLLKGILGIEYGGTLREKRGAVVEIFKAGVYFGRALKEKKEEKKKPAVDVV